jgi:site-specific recombinase XerD
MQLKILSSGEVQALLAYLEKVSSRDKLIIRIMLQCGLRVGEVSGLDVADVWRGGYVHPAIRLRQGTTKGHIARYVDIPEPLKELIGAYVKAIWGDDAYMIAESPLFTGDKIRRRLMVSGIGRIVTKISLAALGRSIHPHMLRHTYATILLKYTNIRVVQTLLGHARLSTTEIYTHVTSEDCKLAVNQAFQN